MVWVRTVSLFNDLKLGRLLLLGVLAVHELRVVHVVLNGAHLRVLDYTSA